MLFFNNFSKYLVLLFLLVCSSNIAAKDNPQLKSSIVSIDVVYEDDKRVVVQVKYIYDGKYGSPIFVYANTIKNTDDPGEGLTVLEKAHVGKGLVQIEIDRLKTNPDKYETNYIKVQLKNLGMGSIEEKLLKYRKVWPKMMLAKRKKGETTEAYQKKLLSDATLWIDTSKEGDNLYAMAEGNLQQVLKEDPHNAEAYVQLARIREREDKAGEGVAQAEKLIKIALSYNKNYANAYAVLGNLYIGQNKIDEAISTLKKANEIGTKNMWVLFNLGRALQQEGESKEAIKIYKQAINKPLSTYLYDDSLQSSNRAIPYIFDNLINLLEQLKDYSSVDKVYQKRINLFGNTEPCGRAKYAEFLLTKLGEANKALKNAEIDGKNNCGGSTFNSIMASIYLKKWYSVEGPQSSDERKSLYNLAQTYIEDMPKTIADLASSKQTKDVIEGLKKQGININTKNNKGTTAITYAVINDDYYATRELLNLGADPNNIIGDRQWSTLMISVAKGDPKIVGVLLQHGAKTEHKSINGITAEKIAKIQGNKQIIKLLDAFDSRNHI